MVFWIRAIASIAFATLWLASSAAIDARDHRAAPVSELVLDAPSGRVLYGAEADRVRPPASLAKMMTLLLTSEAIQAGRLSFNTSLTMTRRGANQPPSRLGLAIGGKIILRTAMRTVAVISANDVAMAMAERVAGTERAFVMAMNRRARELGMIHTRFDNPTGLAPSASRTTARDMATLGRYIASRPGLRHLFSTRSIRWGGRERANHNQLLGKVRGVDGLKTGYTVPAGFNIVATCLRGRKRIIAVVLGAKTTARRDLLVSNLLELGFSSPVARDQLTPSSTRSHLPEGSSSRRHEALTVSRVRSLPRPITPIPLYDGQTVRKARALTLKRAHRRKDALVRTMR